MTAIQSEYSFMERSPERNGVLKICEELGIGFVPWHQLEWGPRRPCFIFPFVCSPLFPLSVSGFFPKRSKRLGGDPQPVRSKRVLATPRPILLLFPWLSRKERLSVWMPHRRLILRGVRSSLLRFRACKRRLFSHEYTLENYRRLAPSDLGGRIRLSIKRLRTVPSSSIGLLFVGRTNRENSIPKKLRL